MNRIGSMEAALSPTKKSDASKLDSMCLRASWAFFSFRLLTKGSNVAKANKEEGGT